MTRFGLDIKASPWGFLAFLGVAIILAWAIVATLLRPPPTLENLILHARFDPNVENQILFRVEGDKMTNEALISRVSSWIFADGTAMPVAMEETTLPRNRQAGDHFVSQEYMTRIPQAVQSDPSAAFRVCFAYNSGLYCTQIAYTDITPLTATPLPDPSPLPEVTEPQFESPIGVPVVPE